jgi:hypothetical protein
MTIARCMEMITPDHVLGEVMSYYDQGLIPPIGSPRPLRDRPPLAQSQDTVLEPLLASGKLLYQPLAMPLPVPPGILSHPILGSKLTVFVLCYGPHTDLAKSCLNSIFATLPAACLDVRVGCNAVPAETLEYLGTLPLTAIYIEPGNIKKYPLMRKMFNDPAHPITTPYLFWFDDDTRIIDPTFWVKACGDIVSNHEHGSRLYGNLYFHDLALIRRHNPEINPMPWLTAGSWWRGRDLFYPRLRRTGSNGSGWFFPAGWCWAMATEMIKLADIPDPRLLHNGDALFGLNVHQLGYNVKGWAWNQGKTHVWTPDRENGGRRNIEANRPFPWLVV